MPSICASFCTPPRTVRSTHLGSVLGSNLKESLAYSVRTASSPSTEATLPLNTKTSLNLSAMFLPLYSRPATVHSPWRASRSFLSSPGWAAAAAARKLHSNMPAHSDRMVTSRGNMFGRSANDCLIVPHSAAGVKRGVPTADDRAGSPSSCYNCRMAQRIFDSLEALRPLVGQEVAVSDCAGGPPDWMRGWAAGTGDRQWIHLDPVRAKAESPYGTTIAHGFLTLSLLSRLQGQALHVNGVKRVINYGLNRVRFPAAVHC